MSTRSVIGVMHGDKCKAIYAHSDGYLSYTGKVLSKYYDSTKANFLVAQGDMSMLGKEIGEKINFDDRMEYDENNIASQCRFYKRDRDETGVDFKVFQDYDELLNFFDGCCAEYIYIMKEGVWYVADYDNREIRVLSEELAKQTVDA